jgi:hypothetical protein
MTETEVKHTEEKHTEEKHTEDKSKLRIVDVPVTDVSSSLYVLTLMIDLAQRRGVYSVEESAKIFECYVQLKKHSY